MPLMLGRCTCASSLRVSPGLIQRVAHRTGGRGGGGGEGGGDGGDGGWAPAQCTVTSSTAMSPRHPPPRIPSKVNPAVVTATDAWSHSLPWSPLVLHTTVLSAAFRLSVPVSEPYLHVDAYAVCGASVRMYGCMHACMFMCMYACACVHVRVHRHLRVCMHVHMEALHVVEELDA